MQELKVSEKWELKAIFYLTLIDHALVWLQDVDPAFARQAAALNCRVRIVVARHEGSRAWRFDEEGVTSLGLNDAVDLTLRFENHRAFVKMVEEQASAITTLVVGGLTVLLGMISVVGSWSLALQFMRLLATAGGVLGMLRREPESEAELARAPVAYTALFHALFTVFARFVAMRNVPHPSVPWQISFQRERRTLLVLPEQHGPASVCMEGVFPKREGAGWRLRDVAGLKRGLDKPLFLVWLLFTRGLRISGWHASFGWIRAFIPFVQQVAPLLQGKPKAEEKPAPSPPRSARRERRRRDAASP